MSDAIKATGRPMLLSLCEWGTSSPWEWAKGIGAMWRTTSDIQDCYDCVRNWGGMGWTKILEQNVNLAPYAGPDHWNDPDMLEVGNNALTPIECRAHFSLWCMMAAPLIAGNNISTMNDTIKEILTAPEIIAVDQDSLGIQGTRIRNNSGLQVWQKPLADGSIAVALLNVTTSSAKMFVSLEEIGFKKGTASSIRDLWNRKDLAAITDSFNTEVEPHGVVVVKIKGERSTASTIKFNQPSVEMNAGNHTVIQVNVFPSVTPVSITSSNEDVVTVSLAGVNTYKLTGRKAGTSTLRAATKIGVETASCNVRVHPSNIPPPWKMNDIRNDRASATYKNGVFSIEGNGSDIWGALDQFAFLNREIDANMSISARILSQTNTDPWAKSGLMFRERADPNSRFILISITPGNGISLQWRETTGGSCDKKDFSSAPLPFYLKLEKNDSTFSAFQSSDGKQWMMLGDITLSQQFADSCLVGMAVCSHSSHMLNLSKFDNVKLAR